MDTALLTAVTNLGFGGIVLILIMLGWLVPRPAHTRALDENARKDEAIEKLQEALALERQRSNDATQAAAVTNQLIGALTTLATEHRAAEKHEHKQAADAAYARGAPATPQIAGKDTGQ